MKPRPMTREEWVQRALDACIAQHGTLAVEDPATLDFLAEVFAHADRTGQDKTITKS